MLRIFSTISLFSLLLVAGGQAEQILKTSGFSNCESNSTITVQNVDIEYNNDNKTVTFNVAGTSNKVQNVTAQLNVTAYGTQVYQNSFNPCDKDTFVSQLCPVPAGSFAATGVQQIPDSYATLIPSIAFSIPDIAAEATLQLKALDTGENVACITSEVNNGKTVSVPAVTYVTAGIAGAALVVAGFSAIGAAAGGGTTAGSGTMSPSFTEVFNWFQGVAMNGMLSVNYPPVYRSFAKNFGFSTGLIPWTGMQTVIDNFRAKTGGNLTDDNVQFLKNATLVFSDSSSVSRRALSGFLDVALVLRDSVSTSVNGTTKSGSSESASIQKTVSGIQAYTEQYSIPNSNTFMTALLFVAVIIAAIVLGILLFKVILETWALFGSFPKGLTGFRKHYWRTMARVLIQLILTLYGVWVLYCIYQFKTGDSWAAKVLAGITLGLFTAVLAYFSFKILQTARHLKRTEGDASGLYDNKETWLKYSIFYDSYKKSYFWLFVPVIIYMFAKGCVLAAADGNGLAQTIAQLVIEFLMLGLLVWNRPFERRSGNVINIFIQVVRALSVVCILVFVEELGIAQTTKTITGVVLIVMQSVLTGVLGILIAVNAIVMCCKENPHRKRRKEAEKLNRDMDDLTPLDARNTLLMNATKSSTRSYGREPKYSQVQQGNAEYMPEPGNPYLVGTQLGAYPSQTARSMQSVESKQSLVGGAAPLGGRLGSPPRQPTVPNVEGYGGYQGARHYGNKRSI